MIDVQMRSPAYVSADTARAVFDWHHAIKAIQAAYAEPHSNAANPGRLVARDEGGWLRVLPAMPPGRYFGAKLMGMATSADHAGAQYATVLFDRKTSAIAAIVDAGVVTGFRTAATSAAALDRLAPAGPVVLGVLGSGLEAMMHVRAFAAIRPLIEVRIFSPTMAKREALAEQLASELGIRCHAVADAATAVANATVVLAAARSRGEQPILHADWLPERTVVVSIGSTVPEQREIDVSVVDACDVIVCDAVSEVANETGDMIAATEAGIAFDHKLISLNALVRDEATIRVASAARILFKSVGGGLQDVVVAGMIFEAAKRDGLLIALPIAFESKRRS